MDNLENNEKYKDKKILDFKNNITSNEELILKVLKNEEEKNKGCKDTLVECEYNPREID